MENKINFFEYLKEKSVDNMNYLYDWFVRYGVSDNITEDLEKLKKSEAAYTYESKNDKGENFDVMYFGYLLKCKYGDEEYSRSFKIYLEILDFFRKIKNDIMDDINIKEVKEIFETCGESLENIEKLTDVIKVLLEKTESVRKLEIYDELKYNSQSENGMRARERNLLHFNSIESKIQAFKCFYVLLSDSPVFVNYLMTSYKIDKAGIKQHFSLKPSIVFSPVENEKVIAICDNPIDRYSSHEFIHVKKTNASNNNDYNDLTVKLYVRVPKEKISDFMSELAIYSKRKNYSIYYKTRSYETNDMITIRINNIDYLKEIFTFLSYQDDIILGNHPFMPTVNGIGVTFDQGGSYNGYLCKTAKKVLMDNKEATYFDFENYLINSKKENFEHELFVKNLLLSKNDDMTIVDFLNEYKEIVKTIEQTKLENKCIREIADVRYWVSVINLSYLSPAEKVFEIEKILNEYKKFTNSNMSYNEILNKWFNIECDSIMDFITKFYINAINSDKHYYKKTKDVGNSYFIKCLIDKWVGIGGIEYAKKALNSIKCVYENNIDNPRFKNANTVYGKDINLLLTYTNNSVPYGEFREIAKEYIEKIEKELADVNVKKLTK